VHRLYRDDDAVKNAIRDRWGDAVFIDGEVDRAAVAGIVFEDRDELEWLEGLLHPRVVKEQQRWLENVTAPIAVVEIPLLYETGADRRFDVVVVVTAPEPVRAGRAGVPLAGRSDRLLPDDEKLKRADFAYVNDGSLADLDAFVAGVVERLTA
jgi:dephospho-CoA kinase